MSAFWEFPYPLARYLTTYIATVPFERLEDAFGPLSLGILIVKDLPPKFCELRHKLLSYSSYLANLPTEVLGKTPIFLHSRADFFLYLVPVLTFLQKPSQSPPLNT